MTLKGLYIQADYDQFSVGSVLVPSGRANTQAMETKLSFLSQLSTHLAKVRHKRRGYILCGGWELMAHHADAEDAGNSRRTPGPDSASERGWLLDLYDSAAMHRRVLAGRLTATPDAYYLVA